VTPNLAFIRPADVVPGWIVPDGEVAQGTPQTLNHGLAFPAPAPQVWVQKNGTSVSLLLLDGTLTGLDILVPPGSSVMSDGTNGLVLSDADGAHYFAPDGWQKITSGNLLAIGPTRWLAWECEGNLCQTMVIDRSNGVRITLPDLQGVNYLPGGTIAPDGSVAALLRDGRLDLVDLVTGEVRHLPVEIPDPHGPSYSDRVVFSPDSRWLLVTDKDGALKIFHARTGQFVNLGVDLPPLYQLAVRNGLPG
jgi:WD40 repeat protein